MVIPLVLSLFIDDKKAEETLASRAKQQQAAGAGSATPAQVSH
jgi:hypothetical protein